jgi:hypothetical protein
MWEKEKVNDKLLSDTIIINYKWVMLKSVPDILVKHKKEGNKT